MDKSWWHHTLLTINIVAFIGVMASVMFSVYRQKKRVRKNKSDKLYFPAGGFFVDMFAFLGVTAYAIMLTIPYINWLISRCLVAILAIVAIGFLLGMLSYFRFRHRLAEDGLHYGTLFSPRRFMAWADIRQVGYPSKGDKKWFYMQSNLGQTIRISTMMIGSRELAQAILANVPKNAIGVAAHRKLEILSARSW